MKTADTMMQEACEQKRAVDRDIRHRFHVLYGSVAKCAGCGRTQARRFITQVCQLCGSIFVPHGYAPPPEQ